MASQVSVTSLWQAPQGHSADPPAAGPAMSIFAAGCGTGTEAVLSASSTTPAAVICTRRAAAAQPPGNATRASGQDTGRQEWQASQRARQKGQRSWGGLACATDTAPYRPSA